MFFPLIEELATTNIVSVTTKTSVKETLDHMARHRVRNVVVVDDTGDFGLITAPDLVKLRFSLPDLDAMIGSLNRHPLPIINKGRDVFQALDVFNQFDHGYAAVVDESGKLHGIVSNTDILCNLDPHLIVQRQRLCDLFYGHQIKRISFSDSIGNALSQLVNPDDAVIVFKEGIGIGIVTTHDAVKLLQQNVALTDPVHHHMSTPLHTVSSELTISEAVTTLNEKHYKRLVVIDHQRNEILGIIRQKDLISIAYSRWSELMRNHTQELSEIIDSLRNKTIELEKITTTDRLTGATSRSHFEMLLVSEQQRHQRAPDVPFSIILFDIDYFKRINDTWGHNVGDTVLKEITQHVKSLLRSIDTVARWGGEEFIILLPQTHLRDAHSVALKICLSISQLEFDSIGHVTASFGTAMHQIDETIATLLGRADDALYQAKRKGRNRAEFHHLSD